MKKIVCVQGLGFVGAAMATAVALAATDDGEAIYSVIGVDLDTEIGRRRVAAINNGEFPFEINDLNMISATRAAHLRGNLTATTDSSVYSSADIIIVDVQLDIPFSDDQPSLEFDSLTSALETVAKRMRRDALLIVETTVPPGTCDKVIVPLVSKIFSDRGFDPNDFLLAHSYERVMPGAEYLNSIINFWRVFSGYTKRAGDLCEEFLASIINTNEYPLTRLGSTTASETAKVLENTYRALNIAFIAEWSRFCEHTGVDLFEVVDAIQKRPTHSNIRYPGLGIGGYCLTKDPAFAPAAARELFGLDVDFPFSQLTVTETKKMPRYAVDKIKGAFGGDLAKRKILVLGLSYKQDVDDTRYSPSGLLYRGLVMAGALVDIHDPIVKVWKEEDVAILSELPKLRSYDALVFSVPHDFYKRLDLVHLLNDTKGIYILDAFMVFSRQQRICFKTAGLNIQAIGVGE
jgi:UDP-N-acetyl-D-glucosamine dehydrogenase